MTSAIGRVMVASSSSLAALIVARVTLICALSLFCAWLARRNRAAVRHAFLAAMFWMILLVPIASIVMPPLYVGVPVGVKHQDALFSPAPDADAHRSLRMADADTPAIPLAPHLSKSSPADLLLAAWAAGAALFFVPVLMGLWQLRSLRRSGLPWPPGQPIVEALARDAGIHRRVEILLHEALPGPMACGVVHPAIVLPRDAANWSLEDLHRAIVHELEHIRRGDLLSRCVGRVAVAVYWFHPVVWTAWRRLVLEAERSCDDAVLRHSEPIAYADQLVGLAIGLREAQRSPLLAMANRADLATRIRAVLDARQRRGRLSARSVAFACVAAVGLAMAMSSVIVVAAPQTESVPTAKFEVASIKRNVSGDQNSGGGPLGGRLKEINVTLKSLISTAYGVRDFQISGGPGWIDSDRYDIEAKAANGSGKQMVGPMLAALLADRFALRLHRETKTLPVYELTVAKTGLKLQPAKEGSCITPDPNNPMQPGQKITETCGYHVLGRNRFDATKVSLADLAIAFSRVLGRTVIDKSGRTEGFDIHLTFAPYETAPRSERPGDPDRQANPTDAPDLFAAVQEQLGLKLESTKGPVEVLVIDHAEKPSEN